MIKTAAGVVATVVLSLCWTYSGGGAAHHVALRETPGVCHTLSGQVGTSVQSRELLDADVVPSEAVQNLPMCRPVYSH